jgi:hypothetical protein
MDWWTGIYEEFDFTKSGLDVYTVFKGVAMGYTLLILNTRRFL